MTPRKNKVETIRGEEERHKKTLIQNLPNGKICI